MKTKTTKILGTIFLILIASRLLHAQSTSVFDANYFAKDNTAPPIKVGKGFHMNDVYRQTRACFTPESCTPNKLTPQQIGGKKTSIKIFYTQTNEKYNEFKSRGVSGKVSYLNLFSFGGQKLEEYSNKNSKKEERFIFFANVDFGLYSFQTEPKLMPEAKVLIDQSKLQDFVKMYGTHYISGVKKESNISVVLTKGESKTTKEQTKGTSSKVGAKIPLKGSGSFEISNSENFNKELSEYNYDVSVDVNGPTVQANSIKSQIVEILNGESTDKASAISDVIGDIINSISDPTQSIPTQYYYSPFSLYGLDGIYWDEKKQNELTKINEAVIQVISAKSELKEFMSPEGKQELIDELRAEKVDEECITKIAIKFDAAVPRFGSLDQDAEKYLKGLETRYISCSDVYCQSNGSCCNSDEYISEINNYNFNKRIEQESDKLLTEIGEIAAEYNKPECEKRQKGVIIIKNLSSNPYHIYQGDKFIETLPGNSSQTYYVNNGTYYFKAVQKSGYMMYPTENKRQATIGKVCQEVVLKVGFED